MKKPTLLPLSLFLIVLPWVTGGIACNKKAADSSAASSSSSSSSSKGAAQTTDADADLPVPAQPPVAGELVMTAKLVEIPGAFPANDLYNYAYVMKYKVIKVLKGAYADADILVGHYNPRIARADIKDEQDANVGGNVKSFQVGDIHYLVLSPIEGAWTGAMEDDFFKEKRGRYWAFWADKLK